MPGFALGHAGLFVVDADRHQGGADGVSAWRALLAANGDPQAPCVVTPSGGRHYYFRQPEGEPLGNHEGDLPPGINVRGAGGYVIAAGAAMPDGRCYSREDGDALILARVCPLPPQWLLDLIRAKDRKPSHAPANGVRPAIMTLAEEERIRSYAEKGVAAELDKLRTAPKGRRNNTLNEAAFSIGTMVGAGWIGEASARDSLLAVALDIGLSRPESLATISSGLGGGKLKPRDPPEDRHADDGYGAAIAASLIRAADGTLYDTSTGEIFEPGETPPTGQPSTPRLAPAGGGQQVTAGGQQTWLHPPGLLGEIADWIIETTPRRPNRPLAVAAAIAVIGTALSRTLAGPTRSGTHLYIACIGGTGIGKDWPQRAIGLILEACALGGCVSSGKWKSDVALEGAIADAPAQVAVIDEIGQNLFLPIMGRRAGAHQTGISGVLRQLWSASFSSYQTSASAARRAVTVKSPALSIFGASTVDEFYASLTGDAAENGFLNRFLLVRAAARAKARRRAVIDIAVPDRIKAGVAALLRGGGNLEGGGQALVSRAAPPFDVMPWADSGVCDAFEAFDEALIDRADADPDCARYLGRTAEMALRLATIHAASRDGRDACLELQDFTWGRTVAEASAEIMMTDVRARMADNEAQAKHKLVERLMRECCEAHAEGTVKRRDLLRRLSGKIMTREVDQILAGLIDAEIVLPVEHRPEGGGRPSLRYLYVGERKAA